MCDLIISRTLKLLEAGEMNQIIITVHGVQFLKISQDREEKLCG